jgi:hypothetical protein
MGTLACILVVLASVAATYAVIRWLERDGRDDEPDDAR